MIMSELTKINISIICFFVILLQCIIYNMKISNDNDLSKVEMNAKHIEALDETLDLLEHVSLSIRTDFSKPPKKPTKQNTAILRRRVSKSRRPYALQKQRSCDSDVTDKADEKSKNALNNDFVYCTLLHRSNSREKIRSGRISKKPHHSPSMVKITFWLVCKTLNKCIK